MTAEETKETEETQETQETETGALPFPFVRTFSIFQGIFSLKQDD
jgi:hypothetical protein